MGFFSKLFKTQETNASNSGGSQHDEDNVVTTPIEMPENPDAAVAIVFENKRDEVYVFGPFNNSDEADLWEAGTRVAAKKMFEGDMCIMRGTCGIFLLTEKDAQRYIRDYGLIDPETPEWKNLIAY